MAKDLPHSKYSYGPRSSMWFLAFYLMISSTVARSAVLSTANVLIYSATRGLRHGSIPTAIDAIRSRSTGYNIAFEYTEDPTWFRDDKLGKYDAIVFLSTTGEILDARGKIAFQNYLNKGGNFVGIHAASDSLKSATFFGQEVGAYLDYYTPISAAVVNVLTKDHPSTHMLPDMWEVTDEMYNFRSDPRDVGAVVILSADESTYTDPGPHGFNQGELHPIAWYQDKGAGVQSIGLAGRSFYTSLGHSNETWQDELFLSHIFGGITWVLDSGTTLASDPNADLGRPPATGTHPPPQPASSAPPPADSPSLLETIPMVVLSWVMVLFSWVLVALLFVFVVGGVFLVIGRLIGC